MARSTFLGEFEQITLLAVARLKTNAYGVAIRNEIEERSMQPSPSDRCTPPSTVWNARGSSIRMWVARSRSVEAVQSASTNSDLRDWMPL